VFSVFHIVCDSVKVKFSVSLLCVYECILPGKRKEELSQNDLYCVRWDVKPYSLTPSLLLLLLLHC